MSSGDSETALARRFYHHVVNGGRLSADDVGRLVRYIEARDRQLDALRWRDPQEEPPPRGSAVLVAFPGPRPGGWCCLSAIFEPAMQVWADVRTGDLLTCKAGQFWRPNSPPAAPAIVPARGITREEDHGER